MDGVVFIVFSLINQPLAPFKWTRYFSPSPNIITAERLFHFLSLFLILA